LNAKTVGNAVIYAQPGGGELTPAYRRMRKHRSAIRNYVALGGNYLGFCLGGYLAGRLRAKWDVPGDESYFRDSAHGFLAWAVATIVSAALLTSAASMVGTTALKGVQPSLGPQQEPQAQPAPICLAANGSVLRGLCGDHWREAA